ncbi:MAG: hypothetical protein WBH90_12390 [Aggregatilineales bacterium]
MSGLLGRINRLLGRRQSQRSFVAYDLGFHGDTYLLDLVDRLMPAIQAFIETGTNVGTTVRYVAREYPGRPVYSCEIDRRAFEVAQETVRGFSDTHLYNLDSLSFLRTVHHTQPELLNQINLYFLDAHGYGFRWPLKEEIAFITQTLGEAFILVDDARVPGRDEFKYDAYDGQVCSLDYIRGSLAPGRRYTVCYPDYSEHTSPHHPLTGYMFIVYGSVAVEHLCRAVNENFRLVAIEQ